MIVHCPNCGQSVVVHGLGRKRLNVAVKDVCDALLKQGTVTAAAKELSCSRAYIYQVLKANGLKLEDVVRGREHGIRETAQVETEVMIK